LDEYQFEIAEHLEAAQRESSLYQVHRAALPEQHPDFDGDNCLTCEEPINPLRLALGRIRCVDCQSRLEKLRAY
jgi:RNA polymerase-binding transcription factor DksA